MKALRYGLAQGVKEHLLSGRAITRLDALILYGVSNLTDVISEMRRQGWVVQSQPVAFANHPSLFSADFRRCWRSHDTLVLRNHRFAGRQNTDMLVLGLGNRQLTDGHIALRSLHQPRCD